MPKENEVKKITVGSIFSWIFGVIFLLAGVGAIATSPIPGIIIIICSAMIIPYFNKLIIDKFNIKISGGVKFLLVIIIFTAVGFTATNDITDSINQQDTSIAETNKEVNTSNTPPKKIFVKKTYNDLWSVFNPQSKYTDLQKEKIFNDDYKGKYAEWTGRVKDVDASILDNLKLHIEHRNKEDFDLNGGDVTVYMKKNQLEKLLELQKGDEVTYSALFKDFADIIMIGFYMEDGELIS